MSLDVIVPALMAFTFIRHGSEKTFSSFKKYNLFLKGQYLPLLTKLRITQSRFRKVWTETFLCYDITFKVNTEVSQHSLESA